MGRERIPIPRSGREASLTLAQRPKRLMMVVLAGCRCCSLSPLQRTGNREQDMIKRGATGSLLPKRATLDVLPENPPDLWNERGSYPTPLMETFLPSPCGHFDFPRVGTMIFSYSRDLAGYSNSGVLSSAGAQICDRTCMVQKYSNPTECGPTSKSRSQMDDITFCDCLFAVAGTDAYEQIREL